MAVRQNIPDFGVVLEADAPAASEGDRTHLRRVVDAALALLEERWVGEQVLVLDGLTPFGRYGGAMAVLDRLLDHARRDGRDGGPRTVVLLCPAGDEHQAPHVDGEAVGMVSGEEWLVATRAWLGAVDGAA